MQIFRAYAETFVANSTNNYYYEWSFTILVNTETSLLCLEHLYIISTLLIVVALWKSEWPKISYFVKILIKLSITIIFLKDSIILSSK